MDVQYAWQQTVVDAFVSLPPQLSEKIRIAQEAIASRLQSSTELEISERIALDDARRALRVLAFETQFESAKYGRGEKKKIA